MQANTGCADAKRVAVSEETKKQSKYPSVAWTRKLSQQFPKIEEFSVTVREGAKLAMLGYRMWKYVRREKSAGRIPIMDPFNTPAIEPLMGVPLGGIGGGSITRGWRGDFIRWQIAPAGMAQINNVEADQFSVYIRHLPENSSFVDQYTVSSVLNPSKPKKNIKLQQAWNWGISGESSQYHALFPRAWTAYEEPDPTIKLVCRQVSPVIPNNYKETSYPCSAFEWTIENTNEHSVEVSVMFTLQNGMGSSNDLAGGHSNSPFEEGDVKGVVLRHCLSQSATIDGISQSFVDPLSFAIAAKGSDDVQVTVCSKFDTNCKVQLHQLWDHYAFNGTVHEIDTFKYGSRKGKSIGAAVAAKVIVPPKSTRTVSFAMSWDSPIARFSSGNAYYRRYTAFYGNQGNVAKNIVLDALNNYQDWESQIEQWQAPILNDPQLPEDYKYALFNELYYLVDGGTIWTTGSKTELEDGLEKKMDIAQDYGHFAYLESLEYLMYNTYDVHFYASFALAMLWPKLELSLQRDVALATMKQYTQVWEIMHTGRYASRKVKGAVPHDMGNPGEDPWNKVNSYCIQDISRWKDLPCKFVLQVYRDYVATNDISFVEHMWPIIQEIIQYALQFDTDGDGVLDNENYPDQTYDTWPAVGCSAYSGGLWLACLAAAIAMAELMKDSETLQKYSDILEKGKESYETKLWNGKYYNYDCSDSAHHDSIMADQLAGQWYAKACGLSSIIPDANAYLALSTVFDYNVKSFRDGKMGAVNGMKPDKQLDYTCMQSIEVWTGTTYAAAAAMLQQGMVKEAFETARGIIGPTYHDFGYMFQTPEAWDLKGRYRSAAYMRPLAIWSMQWAWEKYFKNNRNNTSIVE